LKKTLNIIKNILVWLVVAVAVFMMVFTVFSVVTFNRNDRSVFGYKFYIVTSDSMSKTDFDAGDLIIVKEVEDPNTLKEGDIITYISQNSANFGESVTHKIRRSAKDAKGNPGFITYGTTTNVDDEKVVTYQFILGKYQSKIKGLGYFFQFLKTPQGYIVCIFVPFVLLIIYQGVNCIRIFRKYKQEQFETIQAEKAQIEAEREQNAKMLEELKALKSQLENTKSEVSEAEEKVEATENVDNEEN